MHDDEDEAQHESNKISAETLARRSSDHDFDLGHAICQRRHFGQTGVHHDITDSLIQLSERQQGGLVEARTVFQPRILASRAEGRGRHRDVLRENAQTNKMTGSENSSSRYKAQ